MLALKFFLSCPLDIPSMLTLQPPWTLSTAQTCASPSSHPCEQAACSGPEHTVHSVINKPPHPRKHIRRKSVREHDATLSVPADTRRPSIDEIPCEVMSKTRRLTRTEDSRTQLGGTGASCSKPQKATNTYLSIFHRSTCLWCAPTRICHILLPTKNALYQIY
jgi:hypothetical protein